MYILGDMEPACDKLLRVSCKVHQKSVMDLPHHPCRAHYVVGGGVQDVLGGVVIQHEGVVSGWPQIIRTPYHGGALVP